MRTLATLAVLFMLVSCARAPERLPPGSWRATLELPGGALPFGFEVAAPRERSAAHPPVFIVNGRVPELSEMTRRGGKNLAQVTAGTVLTGAAGSGGTATGRARVILDASDPWLTELAALEACAQAMRPGEEGREALERAKSLTATLPTIPTSLQMLLEQAKAKKK